MVKINLKDAEKQMVERLKKAGLERFIVHEDFREKPEYPHKFATTVVLVKEGDAKHLIETDISDGGIFRGRGTAYCSRKDAFNKRKGRVIATARAMRNIEKYI